MTWLMEVAKGGIQILPLRFNKDGFEFARDVLKGLSAGKLRFSVASHQDAAQTSSQRHWSDKNANDCRVTMFITY